MDKKSRIRRLPQHLVNRIAAGEVIERPASVARELIENAIDAGAQNIAIHVEQDGATIQVRDDGIGMSVDDLKLSTERHATSKLDQEADQSGDLLKYISTLGFRGEALSSIGAVSRLAITSRTQDAANASQIRIEYGAHQEPAPASGQKGTFIRVEDLFHALPARRKFLKSGRYELSLIADVVKRLALAWPEIRFELSGVMARPILFEAGQFEARQVRVKRIVQIMGQEFFDNAVAVKSDYHGIKLAGYASLPTYHRPNTNEQFLFVNARPVRDRTLAGAVRAGYADLIFRHRHPALVLFLTLPEGEVDMNVHPAKAEVRFRDAAAVRLLVVGALKQALSGARHKTANPTAQNAINMMARNTHTSAPSSVSPAPPAPEPQGSRSYRQDASVPQHLDMPHKPAAFTSKPEMQQEEPHSPTDMPLGAARGQLHHTYILAQTTDSIIMVDQHAAHERIIHEQMKASFQNNNIARQSLLVPEIVELTAMQIEHLIAHHENIARFGFTIERYGAQAILVREIPVLCKGADLTDIMRALADDFADHGNATSLSIEEKFDEISGNIACHASIRAGQKLSLPEMDALLRQMEATPHSGQCNHGRPTYIEMKLANIEKLFHRR